MQLKRNLHYLVISLLGSIVTGCELINWIDPKPQIPVMGRVVAFRSNSPIQGVSVKTYKELFNCGSFCTTHELRDSVVTDANGYFSFNASETYLELSVFKKGYFGLFPGDGQITQRIQAGNNDYKTISIKPAARLVVTYKNKVSNQDSLRFVYFACGELVSSSGSPFRSGAEFTDEWDVEGNCTIDILVTVYRRGTRTTLKESFYLPQGTTAYKTIEY